MVIGEALVPFKLKDINGEICDSEQLSGKLLLVIFTCNHCPYARAYLKRIYELNTNFKPRGISIVAINPNDGEKYPDDRFEKMPPFAEAMGLENLYLHDETQEVAKSFGAQRTPEVFLFDKHRVLRYKGAIDDSWEYPDRVKSKYIENAIYALLKGNEVNPQETQAVGCSIKWK
ncbi:MAG: thioredoxin family protein [Chitinophagaceae bacterium]|nr:MAG: thioredoxin family protein [Chitinophagaceae bacterium]